LPVPDAGDDEIICEGSSVTLAGSGGGSYQWTPTGSTSSTINVSPVQTRNYILTVTNGFGCQATDTVRVVVQPLPVVSPNPNVSVCDGENATLGVTQTSGLNYSWSPGGMTTSQIVVTPTQNASYTVVATDAIGCTSSASVAVVVNPIPQAAVSSSPASCNGGNDGSANVLPSVGTAPFTYDWQPAGLTTASVSTLLAGSYTVIITDNNGCSESFPVTITEPTAINTQISSLPASCNQAADGTVQVSVSGGVPGYSYSWSPSSATTDTVANLAAGSYSVTVTDANGCTQINSVNVQEPPALSLNFSAQPVSCFSGSNGSIILFVSGGISGYSYQWNSNVSNTSVAGNLSAGIYSVIVTDSNGCAISSSIPIVEPVALSISTSNSPATCGVADGSATVNVLGGTPGYQFSWSPGGATSATASNIPAGSYDVIVTDNNGCTATAFATIANTGSPVVSAAVIDNVSCFNGSDGTALVQIVSGNGPFTYEWGSGQSNDTATNLSSGVYPIEVMDANGCVALDTISINQPTALQAIATSSPVSCYGGTNGSALVNVNGGVQGYSFSWSLPGQNSRTILGLSAGNYLVTVTDANGCTVTASTEVLSPPPIVLAYSSNPVLCNGGATGSAIILASGGNGAFQYNWSNGWNSDSLSNMSAGNYVVTVTDSLGCNEQLNVSINEPDALQLVTFDGSVSCSGSSDGTIEVMANGGVSGYLYDWQPGGFTTASPTGLVAGIYTVVVTDQNGCAAQSTATVIDPAPVTLQTTIPPVICIGQQALLTADASGGTAPFTFTWNQGGQGDSIYVSPDTSSYFTVVVTDVNGCSTAPQQVFVQVHPPLNVAVDDLPVICGGDSALLSAYANGGNGGPYSYSWNSGEILSASSIIQPIDDSLFVVTVDDGCSPPVQAAVAIDVHPLPLVQFTPQQISGCTPVQVNFQNIFSVPPGSTYSWNLDDQTLSSSANPLHNYTVPGLYDVSLTITTPEGCSASQIVEEAIHVFGFPQADFSQSDQSVSSLTPTVSFFDESIDAVWWSWDFGDGTTAFGDRNPSHQFADSGTYIVQLVVSSAGGCLDTITGVVRVEPESSIFIPNAFTPNGDGVNDGFIAQGVNIIRYEMWIIDRWGLPIFHSVSFDHPWNGTYMDNDRPCQNDVYEYVIEAMDIRGRLNRYIGHVTLVR
jgi:gliding motility-associated-like protein